MNRSRYAAASKSLGEAAHLHIRICNLGRDPFEEVSVIPGAHPPVILKCRVRPGAYLVRRLALKVVPRHDCDHALAGAFRRFLQHPAFPCVGAKSALWRNQFTFVVARNLTSGCDDLRIYPALLAFVSRYRRDPTLFCSFVALFETPTTLSEAEFEVHLWRRLQSLSDQDAGLGLPYDERVNPRPDSPHFSLSFGGEAFFVVGLHPNASRKARRFASPALVFNLHQQFEQLRAEGRYDVLRERIAERDRRYSGSVNPMLATYGEASEARQYSGRAVGEEWLCPFRPRDVSDAS